MHGSESGDLLVVGWGSTRGAIEEAIDHLRADGRKVSSVHLTFLQPLAPGLKEIMRNFKQVITIEGNWCDDPNDAVIDENNRRYSALAMLVARARRAFVEGPWLRRFERLTGAGAAVAIASSAGIGPPPQ